MSRQRRVSLRGEAFVHDIPVDDVPPCGEIIRATVLILQVVRVLPHIAAE